MRNLSLCLPAADLDVLKKYAKSRGALVSHVITALVRRHINTGAATPVAGKRRKIETGVRAAVFQYRPPADVLAWADNFEIMTANAAIRQVVLTYTAKMLTRK